MSKIMYKGRSYANAGVSSDATSIPTADMTAAFDNTAHMNSTDMTSQEVEDFLADINAQGTPSEYKKLLWTNPSPTVAFVAQTISLDLSNYDAIEIVATMYMNNSIAYRETFSGKVGGALVLSATTYGATSDITRLCETSNTQIMFNAGYLGATQNDQAVIPYQIYGIKYERVNPPQVEIADVVIEQGTSGIWTYRKWDSGISECWGIYQTTASHYYTGNGFYGYSSGTIAFPDGLFDSRPIITVDGAIGNGFYLGSIPADVTATSMGVLAMSTSSGSASCHYEIHAFGKWK